MMTIQQITDEALSLPVAERVRLAQQLWASLDCAGMDSGEQEAIAVALQRDAELASGAVIGRTHEDVMQAARHAIKCS